MQRIGDYYIAPGAVVTGDVVLSAGVNIWFGCILRGDVNEIRVGHYSSIQDCAVLHGMTQQYGVYVGDYVTVGHSAILHGCTIEPRCLIGMGCIILNGAVIGRLRNAIGAERTDAGDKMLAACFAVLESLEGRDEELRAVCREAIGLTPRLRASVSVGPPAAKGMYR